MAEIFFKNRKTDADKLLAFGFTLKDADFIYTKHLADTEMTATVTVKKDGSACLNVFDTGGEEYTLFNVPSAAGAFVGRVRLECEKLIESISEECCCEEIYKWEQTKKALQYMREKYLSEPEFLWSRFPDCSAVRRQDNRKWFAAILTVSRRKLGQDSDERAEIIDLRMHPGEAEGLIDGISFFPGYHMNKKHWMTVIPDGTLELEEIYRRIDISYELAKK